MLIVAKKTTRKGKIAAGASKQNGGQQANCLAKNLQKRKKEQRQQQQQQQQVAGLAIAPAAAAAGANIPRTRSKSRLAISTAANQISTGATVQYSSGPPKDPWDPKRELSTRGLRNLGNTCFLNSALQNLFKTRLLHQALFALPERRKGAFVGPMNKALRRVLLEMAADGEAAAAVTMAAGEGKGGYKAQRKPGAGKGIYSPAPLLNAVQSAHPSFKGKYQQDAHELFMHLLGNLEHEEDAYLRRRRKAVAEEENVENDYLNGGVGEASASGGGGEDGEPGEADEDSGAGDEGNDGSNASRSNSKETSVDSATPPAYWTSDGEAIDSDLDPLTPSNIDQTVVDSCDDRPDVPQAKTNRALHPATEKDAAKAAEVGKRTQDISSTTPPMDARTSMEANDMLSSSADLRDEISEPSRAAEKSGGIAPAPSSSVETITALDNGVTAVHCDGVKITGNDLDNLSHQGAATVGGKAPSSKEGGGARKPVTAVVFMEKSASRRTGSAASRGDKDDGQRNRVVRFGDEAETGTDDEGETTDEVEQDDGDGSGGEGAAIAPATCPPVAGLAVPANLVAAEVMKSSVSAMAESEQDESEQGNDGIKEEASEKNDMQRERSEGEKGDVVARLPTRTAVVEVFGGSLCSVVTCGSCGARSFNTEPTVCLSLEIPLPKKPVLITVATRKAAINVDESGPDKKPGQGKKPREGGGGGGGGALLGFELSAKEKRKNKREMQKLLKADASGASTTVIEDGNSDGTAKVDITVAKPVQVSASVLLTPSDNFDEGRKCLDLVIQRVCAASPEDAGVPVETAMDSDSSQVMRPLVKAKSQFVDGTSAAGTATIASAERPPTPLLSDQEGCSGAFGTCGGDVAGDAPAADAKSCDVKVVAAGTDIPASSGGSNGSYCAMQDGTGSAPCGEIDDVAPPVSFHPSTAGAFDKLRCGSERYCDATEERNVGCFGNGNVGGKVERVLVTTVSKDGQNCGNAMAGGSGDPPDRSTWAERVAIGVRGCSRPAQSQAGCTTGEATTGSGDDHHDDRSAFGSDSSGENDEIEETNGGDVEGAGQTSVPNSCADRSVAAIASGSTLSQQENPPVDHVVEWYVERNKAEDFPEDPAEGSPEKASQSGDAHASQNGDVKTGKDEAKVNENDPPDAGATGGDTGQEENSSPAAAMLSASTGITCSPPAVNDSSLNRLLEPPARQKPDPKLERRGAAVDLDLYACLDHFTAEEALVVAEGNGYDCQGCRALEVKDVDAVASTAAKGIPGAETDDGKDEEGLQNKKQDAHRRLLMYGEPPGVLVCHLKRLQASRKINKHVEFPFDLDMAPYFWRDPQAPLPAAATQYRLFGIVQHDGNRREGHYIAIVREGEGWKYASDRTVRECPVQEVKNSQAYMLFYERCDKDPLSTPTKYDVEVAATTVGTIQDGRTPQKTPTDLNSEDDHLRLSLEDDADKVDTNVRESRAMVADAVEPGGTATAAQSAGIGRTVSTTESVGVGIDNLPPVDDETVLGDVGDEWSAATESTGVTADVATAIIDVLRRNDVDPLAPAHTCHANIDRRVPDKMHGLTASSETALLRPSLTTTEAMTEKRTDEKSTANEDLETGAPATTTVVDATRLKTVEKEANEPDGANVVDEGKATMEGDSDASVAQEAVPPGLLTREESGKKEGDGGRIGDDQQYWHRQCAGGIEEKKRLLAWSGNK